MRIYVICVTSLHDRAAGIRGIYRHSIQSSMRSLEGSGYEKYTNDRCRRHEQVVARRTVYLQVYIDTSVAPPIVSENPAVCFGVEGCLENCLWAVR